VRTLHMSNCWRQVDGDGSVREPAAADVRRCSVFAASRASQSISANEREREGGGGGRERGRGRERRARERGSELRRDDASRLARPKTKVRPRLGGV
jgi:hypothetical protein